MFDFLSEIGARIGDALSSYVWPDWDEPGDGTGSRPKGRMEVPDVRGLTVEDAPSSSPAKGSGLKSSNSSSGPRP